MILFVCNDVIGRTMAGPGIRYWELAHALERSGRKAVVLSRFVEPDFSATSITFVGRASLANLIKWIWRSDAVVQSGRPLPILLSFLMRKKMVFDQYDPVIFEVLQKQTHTLMERLGRLTLLLLWHIRQLIIVLTGDFFLVANEKQKDLLIGQVSICGRRRNMDAIAILPFGLSGDGPVQQNSVLRGSKISDKDFLLVWGGSVCDWFDPLILLAALERIRSRRTDIKVYFPGLKPPSPDAETPKIAEEFLRESERLGLLDTMVFVNTAWTPYERRADYLLEADAGISLHKDSLETRFAFRTRILDYLWAGLPIIASKGDSWADLIEKRELGITVRPGDVDAVAQAIVRMADDKALRITCREHVRSAAREYQWDELVGTLEYFK